MRDVHWCNREMVVVRSPVACDLDLALAEQKIGARIGENVDKK